MFTRSSQQLNAVPHQTIISTKNMNIQLKKYTRLTVKITMMAVLLFCLFSVSCINKSTFYFCRKQFLSEVPGGGGGGSGIFRLVVRCDVVRN